MPKNTFCTVRLGEKAIIGNTNKKLGYHNDLKMLPPEPSSCSSSVVRALGREVCPPPRRVGGAVEISHTVRVPENLERCGVPPCVTIGIMRPHFGAKNQNDGPSWWWETFDDA